VVLQVEGQEAIVYDYEDDPGIGALAEQRCISLESGVQDQSTCKMGPTTILHPQPGVQATALRERLPL